jgi:hypothetical protein
MPGMYTHQSKEQLSFYQPMLLPAALQGMQQALVRARGEVGSNKAALAIIRQYCDVYELATVRQEMQLMMNSCLVNADIPQLNSGEGRRNLLLFYEFTMMFFDAVYAVYWNDVK